MTNAEILEQDLKGTPFYIVRDDGLIFTETVNLGYDKSFYPVLTVGSIMNCRKAYSLANFFDIRGISIDVKPITKEMLGL